MEKRGEAPAGWVSYDEGRVMFREAGLSDKDFGEAVWFRCAIERRGGGSHVKVRLSDVRQARERLGPRKSRRE